MDVLPYDLAREVWLATDYEEIKKVCAIARSSSDPNFQTTRELYDNPSAWKVRALRILGVTSQQFDHRSEVEQALPLPGETEGKRAQMRYVELVSRKGFVSDSIYFLNPPEMMIRAAKAGKLDEMLHYFMIFRFDTKRNTKTNNLIHFDYRDQMPDNINAYMDETWGADYPPYDPLGIITAIKNNRLEEANILIDQFIREEDPGVRTRHTWYDFQEHVVKAAMMLGNTEFFLKVAALELSEPLDIEYFDQTIALMPSSAIIRPFFEFYSRTNPPDRVFETLMTPSINAGRRDHLEILDQIILEHPELDPFVNEGMIGDALTAITIQGSQGLQAVEYLLEKGLTKEQIITMTDDRDDGYFASRAVAAWFQ